MKLCRFDADRLGVIIGETVRDVTDMQTQIRAATPYTFVGDAVIAALPQWRERIESAAAKAREVPLASVKLLSPIARPPKVLAAPTNYKKHIDEMLAPENAESNNARYSPNIAKAGIFLKSNTSLVGPSQGIPLRFSDRRNDYEAEVCMIIGKQGTDISQDVAFDYVAGYCLGLDMTLRGSEDRSFRKSCDGYSVLGPWFTTADEVADPADLPLVLKVNGETRQDGNTRDLIYNMPRLIEFASAFYTLCPGDVYYTGTPEGVGPVKPGDVITCKSTPALGELKIDVRAHRA